MDCNIDAVGFVVLQKYHVRGGLVYICFLSVRLRSHADKNGTRLIRQEKWRGRLAREQTIDSIQIHEQVFDAVSHMPWEKSREISQSVHGRSRNRSFTKLIRRTYRNSGFFFRSWRLDWRSRLKVRTNLPDEYASWLWIVLEEVSSHFKPSKRLWR